MMKFCLQKSNMKKECLKPRSVNEILAERYVTIAKKSKDYTPMECEKIKYALKVILNEGEKIFLLILCFLLQKRLWMFFLSFFVIVSTKKVLGGTHRKTFWGCFFFSLFFFSTSCTTTYSDIGVTLKNLYKASYKTKMGDSGGVVYHNAERTFAGIQSGVQNNSKDANGYYNVCFYVDEAYVFSNWGGLNNIFLY